MSLALFESIEVSCKDDGFCFWKLVHAMWPRMWEAPAEGSRHPVHVLIDELKKYVRHQIGKLQMRNAAYTFWPGHLEYDEGPDVAPLMVGRVACSDNGIKFHFLEDLVTLEFTVDPSAFEEKKSDGGEIRYSVKLILDAIDPGFSTYEFVTRQLIRGFLDKDPEGYVTCKGGGDSIILKAQKALDSL